MKSRIYFRRIRFALALSTIAVSAYSQTGKTTREDLKKDEVTTVIYELPYMPGKKVSIVQGYNG